MIKRILFAVFGVPIALILGFMLVNIISAILGGDMSLAEMIIEHKFLFGILAAIGMFMFLKPKRKKRIK